MTTPPVTIERRDSVLIAHLDDGKANALSNTIIDALMAAVDAAERDSSVSALVLHGRPGRFCAGFDLEVMRAGHLPSISELVCNGGALVHRLYSSGVPVIAASTGHALAAGALLLLGCDVRLGADVESKIGLNEVAIGMVLPDWAMLISEERLSRRHLQRAVATARITGPQGAVEAGYLDEIVAADALLDAAVAIGVDMATLDRRAYAGTVRSLRGSLNDRIAEAIAADRAMGSVPSV